MSGLAALIEMLCAMTKDLGDKPDRRLRTQTCCGSLLSLHTEKDRDRHKRNYHSSINLHIAWAFHIPLMDSLAIHLFPINERQAVKYAHALCVPYAICRMPYIWHIPPLRERCSPNFYEGAVKWPYQLQKCHLLLLLRQCTSRISGASPAARLSFARSLFVCRRCRSRCCCCFRFLSHFAFCSFSASFFVCL